MFMEKVGAGMATKQRFGGNWTIEKLEILSSYLDFYVSALKNQRFNKIYIDAFAGTGQIKVGSEIETIKGSAKLALETVNKFDKYIFIEKKKQFAQELQELIDVDHKNLIQRIDIINSDCNEALIKVCRETDWRFNRAVLFLDPYATDVKWETLKEISRTKAIDVWYLFPFSAANRLMKRNGEMDPTWKAALNGLFGDSGWEEEFYKEDPQTNLFGCKSVIKDVNTDSLRDYICKRLETIFSAVAKNPRILYNTKNCPLFVFCFAVSSDNPKANAHGY